ncbi:hypothetical protein [Pseudorhizobium flavum]|uniref:hypothetical protein n=1 Tax=Pseudorhizobium flavum TaxID=1335061 RepID=UPI00376FC449
MIYGTKQIDKFDPPQGFHVNDTEEKNVCGLSVDTVFDLSDTQTLPWSPIYFTSSNGKPIIAGRFTDPMKARLREQYALLAR